MLELVVLASAALLRPVLQHRVVMLVSVMLYSWMMESQGLRSAMLTSCSPSDCWSCSGLASRVVVRLLDAQNLAVGNF